MGSSASNDAKEKDSDFKKMKDAAATLNREIQAENALFEEEVLMSEEKRLPITTVLKRKIFIDQKIATDTSNLSDSVSEVVEGVLSGSSSVSTAIAQGLTTAAQSALDNASMGYNKETGYTLSIGVLGGVQRIDYMMVTRSFSSQKWQKQMKKVVSGVLILSSVDARGLKRNDVSVLVQNCFKQSSAEVQNAIRKLLLIEISELHENQKRLKMKDIYKGLPDLFQKSQKQWKLDEEIRKQQKEESERREKEAKEAEEKARQNAKEEKALSPVKNKSNQDDGDDGKTKIKPKKAKKQCQREEKKEIDDQPAQEDFTKIRTSQKEVSQTGKQIIERCVTQEERKALAKKLFDIYQKNKDTDLISEDWKRKYFRPFPDMTGLLKALKEEESKKSCNQKK